MDHPFRSATFGGFNRQDVLTYLESTAKTAEEQQRIGQQLGQSGHDIGLAIPGIADGTQGGDEQQSKANIPMV